MNFHFYIMKHGVASLNTCMHNKRGGGNFSVCPPPPPSPVGLYYLSDAISVAWTTAVGKGGKPMQSEPSNSCVQLQQTTGCHSWLGKATIKSKQ